MACIPLGRGAIGHVAMTLACIAIASGSLVSAVGCARPRTPVTKLPSETASPEITAGAESTGHAAPGQVQPTPAVTLAVDGTLSWAYLDRTTGAKYGSANASETFFTESMVKAWLAADELSRSEADGRSPDLDLIVPMIRDSDDDAAETVWQNNGADESIERMIRTCQLTDTTVYSGWWSLTMMSARDAVQLGRCIADGTAAGPHWTEWLLDEMRQVRGEGRFGILDGVDATTASSLAIKNGWTLHEDEENIWHVNCLAIDADWVLAVMTTYSESHNLDYGASLCAAVAKQVLGPVTE